jgi:hypothetical protein
VYINGVETEFYEYRGGHVAEGHTLLTKRRGNETLSLVLKAGIHTDDPNNKTVIGFGFSGDYRVYALAALIKAAHLSMFRLFGYRYALSPAGQYVGQEILGRFYLENKGKEWATVEEAAVPFFRQYKAIMRPLASTDGLFTGSVDDCRILACIEPNGSMFATCVVIRTTELLHMVLLPSFDCPNAVAKYHDFLSNSEETIETKLLLFDKEAQCIRTDTSPLARTLWPKNHPSFDI